MAEATIRERVRELVIDAAPGDVGDVTAAMTLTGDLGYDSLSLLELMTLLEDEFTLPPIDADFQAVKTLQDATDLVCAVLGEAGE